MTKDTIITYESGGRKIIFSASSPFWITGISGLSGNNVSISEAQGAGQIGSTLADLSVQPRDITLNGAILSDIQANRRALLACVLPGTTGRLTVAESGTSWYIDGAPKKTPEIGDGSVLQQFQFTLHCPYPYWQNTDRAPAQIAGLARLFRLPRSFSGRWFISKYSDSLFTVVENAGSVPATFDAVFTALTEVTNPELYHVEQRTRIKITKVMAAGEKITISTVYGRRGATLQKPDGTIENAFRYLSTESDLGMQLLPGANTLRSDADNNREGLEVEILAPKGVTPGV